ncbi:MAG: hypothetical protein C9356_04030 [Oleiphilus sp.]|nr:MAG: hypothetical protein C9356_04030 [Oleiphilus sp.]
MSLIEHRNLSRIDCFHVKLHQGFEPEWNIPINDPSRTAAIVVDISPEGCCIILNKAVSIDELPCLEIGLNQQSVTFKVETRWQDLSYSVACKRVGLKFIDPPQIINDQIKGIHAITNDKSSGFLTGRVLSHQ